MKRMVLGIEEAQNSLNWQETGKFEQKRAAAGRRMKSSPILGHPPKSFLTRGRGFQSSPILRVNRGVGNTVGNLRNQFAGEGEVPASTPQI